MLSRTASRLFIPDHCDKEYPTKRSWRAGKNESSIKILCDCGAQLEFTVVISWEEGDLESTEKAIEGKEFWQHMTHCVGE
jgi:hypothetical protein